ncbi:hypothetical protein K9N68_33375 [Kovacikia minuta CCNUW1]|uniref:hypothetical protein n=1 Tax=Kovacikia minuta TaxID=2931930 RepID=UPI001CCAE124|nr:hypothetical protein [Kovacikia minuta]UBF26337.1 hypothetical protein K9N68_33375 [Kovacikia minuta CCNUW1]
MGAIHLSHNNGQADAHDLIPESVWFRDRIPQWSTQYFVTYESLPTSQAAYELLDKRARHHTHLPITTRTVPSSRVS